MSLEAPWASSIFGAMLITGEAMATFAVMIVVAGILAAIRPMSEIATPERLNDLGNLLLAFVMLWAYMSFCQFLIVWSGNLTEEIPWYLQQNPRRLGVGGPRLDRVPVLPAVLPALDSREQAASPVTACGVSSLDSLHALDRPGLAGDTGLDRSRRARGFPGSRLRLSALSLAGVGGIWIAVFVARLKRLPLVPLNDPSLNRSTRTRGSLTNVDDAQPQGRLQTDWTTGMKPTVCECAGLVVLRRRAGRRDRAGSGRAGAS